MDKLITVLATGNEAIIAVAKSLLDDAGIEYFVTGEGLQNLFGFGTLGTGFNPVTGPVKIQVNEHNAAEAREVLSGLEDLQEDDKSSS